MRDFRVLVVDDNEDHRYLTIFALRKASPTLTFSVTAVADGIEALDHLYSRGTHATRRLPDFVLLDLNLPRVSGFDVLKTAKQDAGLSHIPIIILSSSDRPEDVREAYVNGANSFVTKSGDLGPLARYWTETVTLSLPA